MELYTIALSIGGAGIGAYIAIRVTVAKLETRMAHAEEEIKSLRASRHQHANLIQNHEARVYNIEDYQRGGRDRR